MYVELFDGLFSELDFKEIAFLDRDYFFKSLDKNKSNDLDSKQALDTYLSAVSSSAFLGWCMLRKNSVLDVVQDDAQKSFNLMQKLDLSHIHFAVFNMNFINNVNQVPEEGQNYDTNHRIQFQFRVCEAGIYDGSHLNLNFVKVNINNLSNTQDPVKELIPMSNYKFVTKQAINSLEMISSDIKNQIVEINTEKQKDFKALRQREKDMQREVNINKKLKDELNQLMEAFIDLKKQSKNKAAE